MNNCASFHVAGSATVWFLGLEQGHCNPCLSCLLLWWQSKMAVLSVKKGRQNGTNSLHAYQHCFISLPYRYILRCIFGVILHNLLKNDILKVPEIADLQQLLKSSSGRTTFPCRRRNWRRSAFILAVHSHTNMCLVNIFKCIFDPLWPLLRCCTVKHTKYE